MTVRGFIARLQELDQDKQIWIAYDYPYAALVSEIGGQAGEEEVLFPRKLDMRKYIIR